MLLGNIGIAFFAGLGLAMWVYAKTSYRGGVDFKKKVAPAAIAGVFGFLIALTLLWVLFG